ncbi:MAG TPA: ferrous iron transport protein B, partial [bacterium]|nr:ferrous iron transport protein B [bacterium]
SSYPTDLLGSLLNLLGRSLTTLLPAGLFQSLVVDGILGGLSGVLVFIPQIALLFFGLALLEDSGYMARAAFLMDEAMHRIGLHGKSFIPMLLGFGCNVPAVMATRTLTNRREKILTCLLIPFMSCSARLPVYVLLVSAFFPPHVSGSMLFLLYLIGIASAILLALLLNRYILKDEKTDFILELPPYRLPSLNSLFLFVWHRIRHYLEKAGTIILLAAAAIWFLTSFPAEASARGDITGTYAGMLGRIIEPLISPLGFDWKIGIAIITGFAAKELVIGTLATIYSVGSPGSLDLGAALAADPAFSPLVAFSLMLFVLLYVPCLATIAVIRQELSGKWAIIAASLTTGWAWIVCFAVFQIGRQLGLS